MKKAQIEVTMIDRMGGDLSVVNSARVSFSKESKQLSDSDKKLITYLAKHQHTSPFNHAFASFRVKAPIFVARQLVKHKFLPWNEVSRRYVDSEPEFYMPEIWRRRADNVKQGSSEEDAFINPVWAQCKIEDALSTYDALLEDGVCPEQARMVLPQNTMTEWIWSGSLGAWADMCRLRLDPHAQKETREVAEKISAFMDTQFPVSWKALIPPKSSVKQVPIYDAYEAEDQLTRLAQRHAR